MKLMGASRESGAGLEFVTVAPRVFLSYRRADTLDVAQGLSKWLREDLGGANGEVEVYPGVHHGFAFPQRQAYNKAAAEQHWERVLSLFGRRPRP